LRLGPPDIHALSTKYERMLALRIAHDESRGDPSRPEPDPRAELADLARAFPGALRELDQLPLAVIRGRLAALRAAAEDPTRIERWMIAQDAFHELARGALAAKLWLGRTRAVTEDLRAAFRAEAPEHAREWADALESVASPPRGRLMDLVHARLAEALATTVEEARRLVEDGARASDAGR
jgi:hypothetical protein